jgi:hypothetical protein
MADNLLDGLRGLFYEHNIEIDEETVDVVAALEEELEEVVGEANKAITENIALTTELASLRAEKVFNESVEGLTVTQAERLRVLAEKINHDDLESYADDLATLKESFFKVGKKEMFTESAVAYEDDGEPLTEETVRPASPHATVNAYVAAIEARRK